MKKYVVLFSNNNKILFQDETGIVDPEEVLDLLFNDKAEVEKEERMAESNCAGDYFIFHSVKYTVRQVVE